MLSSHLFAKHYINSLNAFESAKANGFAFDKKPAGYYVYFLLHPISGKIIYVGKGKGKRKDAHLRNYYNSNIGNARKHHTIGKIVKEGFQPLSVIFDNDLDEPEALQLESFFIEYFRDYGISNASRGEKITLEQSQEIAKSFLARVMHFDKWCALEPRTETQKKLYWLIKKVFKQMTVTGNTTGIKQATNEKGTSIHYEYS